jgi:uncharacterized membrane protein
MQPSFFRWYYSHGLSGAFAVWFNIVRAVWLRGNIADLASTLFAPWHRDSSPRTWVGLHPVLAFERFTLNIMSRFVGMIVRLLTIGIVILVSSAVFLLGGIVVFAYIFAPLLLILASVFFLMQSSWLFITLLLTCVGLGVALYGFMVDRGELLPDTSFVSLKQSSLFDAVLFRLGFEKKEHQQLRSETEESFLNLLAVRGLSESDYQTVVLVEKHFAERVKAQKEFWTWERLGRQKRLGKSWKYGYTVHLDRYITDLSENDYSEYRDDELIGKEGTLKSMLEVLERSNQHSLLLVGDAGIGKQSLVHYLARLIRENSLEGSMFDDMRVLWLDVARVISDADASGALAEDELRQLFTEATLAGNCILATPHIERYLLPDSNGRHFRTIIEEFLAYPTANSYSRRQV